MIALISLYFISFLLLLLGKKWRIPLFSLFIIIAYLSSREWSQNRYFNHFELPQIAAPDQRMVAEQYVVQWIEQRLPVIKDFKGDFPVIFVSAEGGGSRAALWSFLVHSYLEEKSAGRYSKNHLFSLSGASGGSVGNSLFFAHKSSVLHKILKDTTLSYPTKSTTSQRPFRYKASTIFQKNYLSTALAAFLGRDLLKSITNIGNFKNRGDLLEQQWSTSFEATFPVTTKDKILKQDFRSFFSAGFSSGSNSNCKKHPTLIIYKYDTCTKRHLLLCESDILLASTRF